MLLSVMFQPAQTHDLNQAIHMLLMYVVCLGSLHLADPFVILTCLYIWHGAVTLILMKISNLLTFWL